MVLPKSHERSNEPSQRQRRVGMIIHRALSALLIQEGYKTRITEVVITKDLRLADIYILPQDDDATNKKSVQALKNNQTRIKQKLVGKLDLKYMPQIRFRLDEHFAAAQKLNELLF